MTLFWLRHQITLPKLRHRNDVTNIFHFQASPPLSKVLVPPLSTSIYFKGVARGKPGPPNQNVVSDF